MKTEKPIIKQLIEAKLAYPNNSKGYNDEFGFAVLVLEKFLSSCICSYLITRGDYNVQ